MLPPSPAPHDPPHPSWTPFCALSRASSPPSSPCTPDLKAAPISGAAPAGPAWDARARAESHLLPVLGAMPMCGDAWPATGLDWLPHVAPRNAWVSARGSRVLEEGARLTCADRRRSRGCSSAAGLALLPGASGSPLCRGSLPPLSPAQGGAAPSSSSPLSLCACLPPPPIP